MAINTTVEEQLRKDTLRHSVILRPGLGNLHDVLRKLWCCLDGWLKHLLLWRWRLTAGRLCGLRHGDSQRWCARAVRVAGWCWYLCLILRIFWKAIAWHAHIIARYI